MLAIVVQWGTYRVWGGTSPLTFASSIVIGAVLDAVVLAQTKTDVDGAGNTWALVLERLWVVVLTNFIFSLITAFALQLLATSDGVARVFGAFLLPFAAALVFAECIGVASDDARWWWLLPAAVGGSLRISWQSGASMSRAIVLFAIQLVPIALAAGIEPLLTSHHVPLASFWSAIPLGILVTIPLDVLIVLSFFDMSGYRQKSTADE